MNDSRNGLRLWFALPIVAMSLAACGGGGSTLNPTPVATATAAATATPVTTSTTPATATPVATATAVSSSTAAATATAAASATAAATATAAPSGAATTAPTGGSTAFAVTTVAGSGAASSLDGTGSAATFSNPIGIQYVATAQGDPTVFVTDQGTGYLRGLDLKTSAVTTYNTSSFNAGSTYGLSFYAGTIATDLFIASGTGVRLIALPTTPNPTTTPGPAGSALGSPAAIGVDTSGDLYTTDAADGNFYELLNNQTGHVATELASTLPIGGNYGLAVTGALGSATAYFTDFGANTLSSATTTPMMVTVTMLADGGPLDEPAGMVFLNSNLYIANCGGNNILKATTAGVVTAVAGSGTAAEVDGDNTAASFDCPFGITTDGANLYVADMNGNKIREITNVQ